MKMVKYKFDVRFTPQAGGGFTAEVPELPGCISEGDTMEEAEINIKEAIELYLEMMEERGIPLPTAASSIDVVQLTVTIDRDISEEAHA